MISRTALKKIGWVERGNAAWKAWRQDRRVAHWREHYRREAERLGIGEAPRGEALKAAVAERLARKGRKVVAKRKGELNIFCAYGLWNWERFVPLSLREFGEVTEFEWRSRGFNDTVEGWLGVRDEMNREMLLAFRESDARRKVDVVVGYVSGYTARPELLEEMGRAGAVVLNFCYDDKLYFPGRMAGGRLASPAGVAGAVDLNLTSAPGSVVKYMVHGGLAMFWPEAGYPGFHRPTEAGGFDYDVTFVGTNYGWRGKLIEGLRRRGIAVECFGRGWPRGGVSDEEIVRLFSRSRVNLGVGGVGYSRRTMCLKGRDFEAPMAGGLYLTSENPELSLCFEVGREILTYRDAGDCAEIIRRLLQNPGEAEAIRLAGRRRALRDHTYERRWTEAFETVGLLASV